MNSIIDIYRKAKDIVLEASKEIKDKIVKELPEDFKKKLDQEGINLNFTNIPLVIAEALIYIYDEKKKETLF